jgi:hypothetical protein
MLERLTSKDVCLLLAAVFAAATVSAFAADDKKKSLPATEPAEAAKFGIDIGGFRAAASRQTSKNNLLQIGLAFHNYASTYKGSPLPGDILDKDGKPLLSWRVSILPYIEEGKLYKQFKLDEPWDSKHNLALLEKMPKGYTSPRVTVKRKGYTVYQVFTGPAALFNAGKPRYNIGNIPDGTSNTLLAVETSKAVPWTKPADIPFDKTKAVPELGKAYANKPLAVMMDGSARELDLKKIKPETLKNAIMPDDGNKLGKDW